MTILITHNHQDHCMLNEDTAANSAQSPELMIVLKKNGGSLQDPEFLEARFAKHRVQECGRD